MSALGFVFAPATMWGFAAALPAVTLEYLFRRLEGPWHSYWYIFIPAACFINFAVCQLVRQPGLNLIDAFIVFAFSTTLSRTLISVFILGDHVGPGSWFALGLLLMARVAQIGWR
jgi:hypothetical protein